MRNEDKVIYALNENLVLLCDDCLSASSKVKPRQSVYQICNKLSEKGTIIRNQGICKHCHKSKLANRSNGAVDRGARTKKIDDSRDSSFKWFWEGNVQSWVVSYLSTNGYMIRSVADTTSRTQGKDIIAIDPDGQELWVSVKGYPEKSPNTQARHWFSSAIFDLVLYREENPDVNLALALPSGYTTYMFLE